jgi:hypothetical protein
MLLFLGIDGVLHPEPCFKPEQLFCRQPLLEELLRPLPDVAIVVSSSWRELVNLSELRSLFSPEIAKRIIDQTPYWYDHPTLFEKIGYQRQTEIEAWLRQSHMPWAKWVALDDKPWLFAPSLANLVCCRPDIGLEKMAAERLHAKLHDASPRAA